MIIKIEDLFNDSNHLEQIQSILRNSTAWVDGKITAGIRAKSIKSNLLWKPESAEKFSAVTEPLQTLFAKNETFHFAAMPRQFTIPMINRYSTGMCYGQHTDDGIMGRSLRTDLAATLFLSDPKTYDGGELILHHAFDTQKIKLPAGHLVIYPANTIHEVAAVTEGIREVAVFWIQSMIRKHEHRQLLWTQHQAIESLFARDPEAPELLVLAANYQNLIREWSEY